MSDNVHKIEFDAFVGANDWPIIEPFTEDKEYGGFIDLGATSIYAHPGQQKDYASWLPIKVKVTIERIMEEKPNAKKSS